MLTPDQLQARAAGIGGSDAPAILNLSPFKTAVQLWLEKTGQAAAPDLSDEEHVQMGHVLEPVVARLFSERTGLALRRVNRTLRSRERRFMVGNIDRRVLRAPELVEIKTVRNLDGDGPRSDHVAQATHYLAVTGWDRAWLVYLVAGQRLVWFTVERNEQAIGELVEREVEFWRHVQDGTPPPATSAMDMRLLYPVDSSGSITADDSTLAAVQRLAAIRQAADSLEQQKDEAEKEILAAMGEAARLVAPDGRELATWKQAKPSRVFDRARLEAEHPDIAAGYWSEKPGSRRFLLKVA